MTRISDMTPAQQEKRRASWRRYKRPPESRARDAARKREKRARRRQLIEAEREAARIYENNRAGDRFALMTFAERFEAITGDRLKSRKELKNEK